VGVRIREGIAKVGTQLCCIVKAADTTSTSKVVVESSVLTVGRITRILLKNVEQQEAGAGAEVSIQITGADNDASPLTFGRQFGVQHPLVSKLTRESIDALKQHYRQEVCASDWQLVVRLKKMLAIV
jgi:translation initiation factor 5B